MDVISIETTSVVFFDSPTDPQWVKITACVKILRVSCPSFNFVLVNITTHFMDPIIPKTKITKKIV
jgi:hypothetical protein